MMFSYSSFTGHFIKSSIECQHAHCAKQVWIMIIQSLLLHKRPDQCCAEMYEMSQRSDGQESN